MYCDVYTKNHRTLSAFVSALAKAFYGYLCILCVTP
jgi:hypothetical protein